MCTSRPTATATSFSARLRCAYSRVTLCCHVLTGSSQIEDMNSQAQLSAAQHLASGAGAGVPNIQSSGIGGGDEDDDDIPELEAVEEDGNVDETGVDPKDIELVIQQVGCSRAKAVRVLKESGGDLINASAYVSLATQSCMLRTLQSWLRASDLVVSHCIITALLCAVISRSKFIRWAVHGPHNLYSVYLHFKLEDRFALLFPASQFYKII